MTKPFTVAAIFARGGSRQLPRKNLHLLGGKPLLAYSIEPALACDKIDRVIVSTDDSEIAEVARKCGAETPFLRPAELATDTAPEHLAWQHAISYLRDNSDFDTEKDIFISLPPTGPLRLTSDIEKCLDIYNSHDTDMVVTVRRSLAHPSFSMLEPNKEGYYQLSKPPPKRFYHRQEIQPVYDIVPLIYLARPQFILDSRSYLDGRIKVLEIPFERSIDIDKADDLRLAEFMLTHR